MARFPHATRADDDRPDFHTQSGTFQGHNTAPWHKAIAAGGSHQAPDRPVPED